MIQPQPIQKILFGSPGTGKSYQIRTIATEQLGIAYDEESKLLKNTIKTVFHPEYTYPDFMGKLLPLTQGNSVIYKFYPGHFLRSLGMAYQSLIDGKDEHCLLVIDELNRGNAAAIFGTAFQLLDRESDNWSTYHIDISEMELVGLLTSMKYKPTVQPDGKLMVEDAGLERFCDDMDRQLERNGNTNGQRVLSMLKNRKISMPCNLSIIATINTSDESIYYLDSAFKRRWDWEYVESPSGKNAKDTLPDEIAAAKLKIDDEQALQWHLCVIGLNELIKSQYQTVRRIEDKQIGWWFIKPENGEITLQKVKDKVMFYLWDSVFVRDKRPLEKILSTATDDEPKLITYADFVEHTAALMTYTEKQGRQRSPNL
ncbi:restriction endonuclease [Phormidium sp. CCY1219]|uniref:restriction endonuclease n=1 Tax=Phormidium sp. CCY1219 TaxID=2886104 RepID=UPI002D1F783C|nr:restriction endonuclease [Phormidium sp. CCY1219]MEB3827259.1 restriction endonuclease [Phormidium sp. CCY1219]